MKLKAKLTVLLGVVITTGVALSALAVRAVARRELEAAAAVLSIAVLFPLLMWLAAYLSVKPLLENLRVCAGLAKDIQAGRLHSRVEVHARDEIGELARVLNAMASSLEENRREIQEAERKYREVFENAVEGIFQVTLNGVLVAANPALARLMGWSSSAENIGRTGHDRWADPSAEGAFLKQVRERGHVSGLEVEFVRQDGVRRSGRVTAIVTKDAAGHPSLIQGFLEDITEEREARETRERAMEAERLLAEARLQALRYQINPHFLFNTLNAVDALARQAPERIPALLRELARYLRFAMDSQEARSVPLREELRAIESYLNVERVRFGPNLDVVVEADPEAVEQPVPPLVLQPLVENAIKHGMQAGGLPLRIRVTVALREEHLSIEVANTGRWAPPETVPRARVGLDNLRKRIDILYHGRGALRVSERQGWVRAELTLPRESRDGNTHRDPR